MEKIDEDQGKNRIDDRKGEGEETGEGQAEDDGDTKAGELTAGGPETQAGERGLQGAGRRG